MAKEEDNYLKRFGKNLLSIKEARNISYRKLAEKCELDHSDIKRYTDGEINLTLLSILELSKALEVHPRELFDFD